jgi:ABC-type polysaccharide/polyol phosphate transport system ATPase subunit
MPAIELRDVHKRFFIPHEKHTTLTERLLASFRPRTYERFEALRGVDFVVEKGSAVGVIGGNGSGKSTLLKIISGLLPPDRGTVSVDGTLSALLELGLGFNNELTVRENVELYAAVLGYPRREVHRRVGAAIEFADLERFRDAKLKNLSTGMRARLGFATALQAESDILLLDEILAVGDADFQLKCLNVFEDLKRQRRTMVLVTHDLRQVQRFCDEAVWIQDGQVAAAGDPDDVIRTYVATIGKAADAIEPRQYDRVEGDVRVREGWVENTDGKRVGRLRSGESGTVVVLLDVVRDVSEPRIGFGLKGEDGVYLFSNHTQSLGVRTAAFPAGTVVEMRGDFLAALRNGRYEVSVGVATTDGTTVIDLVDGVTSFVVHGSRCQVAMGDLGATAQYLDLQADIRWQIAPERTRQELATGPAVAARDQGGRAR